jgi:hypothetical protein
MVIMIDRWVSKYSYIKLWIILEIQLIQLINFITLCDFTFWFLSTQSDTKSSNCILQTNKRVVKWLFMKY